MALRGKEFVLSFYAQDLLTGGGKTGDSANITLRIVKDGGTPAAPTNSISEINATTMKGMYKVTLTVAEMTADGVDIKGETTSADVEIYPRYIETHTESTAIIGPVNGKSNGSSVSLGTENGVHGNTQDYDGLYWGITDAGTGITGELTFNIGSKTDYVVDLFMNFEANGNRSIAVSLYNYILTQFDLFENVPITGGTFNSFPIGDISQDYVDTNGDIRMQFLGVSTISGNVFEVEYTSTIYQGETGSIPSSTENAVATEKLIRALHGVGLYAGIDIIQTTIETVTDQTHLILSNGSSVDDEYVGAFVIIMDTDDQLSVDGAYITDYVGSTRTVTLSKALKFTVATGDFTRIVANPPVDLDSIKGTQLSDDPSGYMAQNFSSLFLNANQVSTAIMNMVEDAFDRIGVPVGFDGGAATLGSNLAKIVDDNNGINYDPAVDSLHARTAQISAVTPSNEIASAQVITNGTVDAGDYTSTHLRDGAHFQLSPDGVNPLDFYLKFPLGARRPDTVKIFGRMDTDSGSPFCDLFAWNWDTPGWDAISTASNRMNETGTDTEYILNLLNRHKDPITNEVWIRWLSNDITATRDLFLDSVWVSAVLVSATKEEIADAVYTKMSPSIYQHAITIDSNNGTAGTEVGLNGLPGNPSSNLADALNLATQIGLRTFIVLAESSLTLTAACSQWTWVGLSAALNFGGYDVDSCGFRGFVLSGTCTSSTGRPLFEGGTFLTVSLPPCIAKDMGFTQTITLNANGDYVFKDCASGVAGGGVSIIDCDNNDVDINLRNFNGGVEVRNMNANSKITFDGRGQIVFASSCTGGEAELRGPIKKTDNSNGAVAVTEGNRLSYDRNDNLIYVDATNGVAGTDPRYNGLPDNPVSNFADAVTMATALLLHNYWIASGTDVVLAAASYYDYSYFVGQSKTQSTLDLNGKICNKATFVNLTLTNSLVSTALTFKRCIVNGGNIPEGTMEDCLITQNITLLTSETIAPFDFKDCVFDDNTANGDPITINVNGIEANITISNFSGKIKITNNTHINTILNIYGSGSVFIDASCTTAKSPFISGNCKLTDNGSSSAEDGARVDQENIRDSMALATTDSILSGSVDEKLNTLTSRVGTPVNLDDKGATLSGNTEDIFEKLGEGVVIGEVTLAVNAQNKSVVSDGAWVTRTDIDGDTPKAALEETKQATANDFSSSKLSGITDIKDKAGTSTVFSFETKETGGDVTTKKRVP